MSRKKFTDAMSSRSPLTKREPVTPVNMYQPAPVEPVAHPEDSPETPISGEPESQNSGKPESRKRAKAVNERTEKYSTLLRPETIRAIKREALETERKDYEVVQAALDAYLRK